MTAPLVFESLTITNFAGYYGKQSVKFPVGKSNVMPVNGKNTAGKTSFINAIKWCLYGKVSSRTSDQLPLIELFNSIALLECDGAICESIMSVSMDLIVQDKKYTLTRTAKLKNPRVQPKADKDFEISVYLNDGSITHSASDANNLINKVAPFSISRFFLFDGELLNEYENLIQNRNNKKDNDTLIDAIEDVLGIPAMSNASKIIREASRLASSNMERLLEKQHKDEARSKQLKRLIATREELDKEKNNEEILVHDIQRRINELKEQIDEESHQLSKSDKYRDTKTDIARAQKDINDQRIQLTNLGADAWKDLLCAAIDEHYGTLTAEMDSAKQNRDQDIGDSRATDQLKELLSVNSCTTCGQHLTPDSVERIRQNLNILSQEQETRRQRIQHADALLSVQQKYFSLQFQVRPISDTYHLAKTNLDKYVNHLTKLEDQKEKLFGEIGNFDKERARQNREEFEHKSQEVSQLKKSIDQKVREIEAHDTSIDQIVESINSSESSVEFKNMHLVNTTLTQLHKLFNESQEVLREKMRKHIEDIASKAYRKLIHEEDHQGIKISPNTYSMEIVNTSGTAVVNPSAGATQIMALSLIIALGRAGRSIGPIVMDTPFGRLDIDHRQRVMRHLPNYANQLVLLYHSGELDNASLRQCADRIGVSYIIDKESEGSSVINEA